MADVTSTTSPDGAIQTVTAGPKIAGFTARHTAGGSFQAACVEINYVFEQPVDYIDAVAYFGDAQSQAEEQAEAKLADTLARRAAQVAAVSPQPAAPPAAPHPVASPEQAIASDLGGQHVSTTQPGGLPVSVGTTPKGGQVRYVPTSHLSSQAFEQAIRLQIAALGFDETEFAVFDNRTNSGQYPGFEEGGANYSTATIKARNDSRAQKVLDKKTAFYADFDDAGQLTVKASKEADSYKAAAAAFA